jgi:hypothetical protein
MDIDKRIMEIQDSMTNHTPDQNAINRIETIRKGYKSLIVDICYNSPESEQQKEGIKRLEESLMWVVKSIVLDKRKPYKKPEILAQSKPD